MFELFFCNCKLYFCDKLSKMKPRLNCSNLKSSLVGGKLTPNWPGPEHENGSLRLLPSPTKYGLRAVHIEMQHTHPLFVNTSTVRAW